MNPRRIIRSEAYANRDLARMARSAKREQANSYSAIRQRVAIARYDARKARERARERIARLSYCCAMLALSVALFYSATGAA